MTPSDLTIRRALESGNPVVQGNKATFLWQGEFAPLLISDVHGWKIDRDLSNRPPTLRSGTAP